LDLGKRSLIIAAVFLLTSSSIMIASTMNVEGSGYNVDITVGFDDHWMEQELAPDYIVSDPLPIHWYAKYQQSRDLKIDLFIRLEYGGEWILIVEGYQNTGTYDWDLLHPYVLDGDYILKIIAWAPDHSYCDSESQFAFHVKNKKIPKVMITTESDGMEVSGAMELAWNVIDEDTPRYLINSDVYISGDDGESYSHLQGFNEDPGKLTIDTSDYQNGNHYRFRVDVFDQDGLSSNDVSDRFIFYNNMAPKVEITSPKPDQGLFGKYRIEWNASDIDEPSYTLLVNLWIETVHDGGRTDLLRMAPNKGYYLWDTSQARQGPEGHLIGIQLMDSRGLVSDRDLIRVWVLNEKDDIMRDISYPRDFVMDEIRITWNTYPPVRNVSKELGLWVYHKAPAHEWQLLVADGPDAGEFSLNVTEAVDGYHGIKVVLMDSFYSWIHDEVEVTIEVYHEMEPEMLIRGYPLNGTNAKGVMEFDVAGYDGNGDRLTYIGLYNVNHGGWQLFDIQHGNYRQMLRWNTSGLGPGEYRVRIAVYDSSRFNLSTSQVVGPYFKEDNDPPPYHPPKETRSKTRVHPLVWALFILLMVLIMVIGAMIFVIRKDRKKVETRDMDIIKMNPRYVQAYLKKNGPPALLEKLLPSIGRSSGKEMVKEVSNGAHGLEDDERARLEGYLEMFDPDLVDNVTRSDIDSYIVLGVGYDATADQIRNAYMGFVKRYHPDKLVGKDQVLITMAQEELRRKNRARAILLDPQKRALVDKMLRETEAGRIRELSVRSVSELRLLGRK
jgi:hypothetical protein